MYGTERFLVQTKHEFQRRNLRDFFDAICGSSKNIDDPGEAAYIVSLNLACFSVSWYHCNIMRRKNDEIFMPSV